MAASTNQWTNQRWKSVDRDLASFRRTLPPAGLEVLVAASQVAAQSGREPNTFTASELPLGQLKPFVDSIRDELVSGSGFVLLDGFPVDELDDREIEYLFWGLGLRLGSPVSQSVMGERLGHVRDMTATDPHARAYRNKSELTPHTDPADLLSFLCLRPAATGGVSRFASALAIRDEIESRRPDLFDRLERGFHYHRGGENRPGSAPITPHRVPLFSEHEGAISCRYVRHYIEVAAAEDPDITLEPDDTAALDLLEELAADPAFHHEFTLRAGEAVFANNFTVFHARSSFSDDAEASGRRHLLRLWLSTDPIRPVVANIAHFEGEPGIPPVDGRMPSYKTTVEVQ